MVMERGKNRILTILKQDTHRMNTLSSYPLGQLLRQKERNV